MFYFQNVFVSINVGKLTITLFRTFVAYICGTLGCFCDTGTPIDKMSILFTYLNYCRSACSLKSLLTTRIAILLLFLGNIIVLSCRFNCYNDGGLDENHTQCMYVTKLLLKVSKYLGYRYRCILILFAILHDSRLCWASA